ncbi:1-aminocyclopropane-1-carboxylate oxidase homolog 1-like isoform X2 [Cynara cardunculus var. scolymus]|uniref:1-aminocyclopropane-1-carboxylate oxidase homolog 1-like isoform X2 n=1 Tax=Cynara cardunculus var. scolymus TaxID=59895 RepID=UPI000D62E43A|nr:1-aminocyclopropane-1-carboxylate oxidase homolog 1-like isoform X2 [Cynara cardunculus var. scolymus]
MTINGDDFDRKSELKAFDDTKGGVKGLVDSGITEVPRIFIQPPEVFPQANNTDFDLPIINLHGFISDPVRRKEIVKEVGEASRTWGFFQVINHGIPVSVMREMKDGVLRFFNQDHDLKKEWMAPDPPNLHELPPPFRDILIEYSDQVTELGFLLFKLISEALGLDSNYLKEIGCADGLATICHYYPVSPQPELTIGAQKHADNGFLTVLLQDHIGGLQFLHRNQWLNVPFVPGALLVNIGDLLQLVSNDEFVSREHRVVSNGVSPRVSVACFFTTGMVSTGKIFAPITELLSEENPAKYRATTVAEFAQYSHSKALDKSCMLHFRI